MDKAVSLWSVPVTLEEIPESGLHRVIEAPAEARAAIAKLAGLRELARLSAEFDLTRRGAGVAVSGRVQARVGQTCVVTLEPIENTLDEPIDVLFEPAAGEPAVAAKVLDAAEQPESLVDGKIDLGALATEFLMLGIDPYPRKAGAEFAPPKVEDAGDHPFAALAALKKRPGGGAS
jgi:Large ribosomal RNA subunit accumulation protein YceD